MILIKLTDPFVIVAVAVAVVPNPIVPSFIVKDVIPVVGIPIDNCIVDSVYPAPALTILKD